METGKARRNINWDINKKTGRERTALSRLSDILNVYPL
jgi:hypothetical protein